MKLHFLLTLGMGAIISSASAQFVNNGNIYVAEGAILSVNMDFQNKGQVKNNGYSRFSAHILNNSEFVSEGKIGLNSSTPLRISGTSPIEVNNLILESDVELGTNLIVKDKLEFKEGVIYTVGNTVVDFTSKANHTGATDFSHIAGNVRKEGEGEFVFPLGDGYTIRDFKVENLEGRKLEASYKSGSPLEGSEEMARNVEAVNTEEHWVIKSNEQGRVGVSLANNEVVSLEGGVWKDARKGVVSTFTSGKTKDIEKSIGVWPNPTSGEFNLKLTGMEDQDQITVDITNQNGSVIQSMKGKVKDLRKVYQLPSSLSTTTLKIRVINGEEILTQTLILNK